MKCMRRLTEFLTDMQLFMTEHFRQFTQLQLKCFVVVFFLLFLFALVSHRHQEAVGRELGSYWWHRYVARIPSQTHG